MAFIAQKSNSVLIKPVCISIGNFEIADRAMLMVPHALDQVEFVLVVPSPVIRLPMAVTIYKLLIDQSGVRDEYRLHKCFVDCFFPCSFVIVVASVNVRISRSLIFVHSHNDYYTPMVFFPILSPMVSHSEKFE